MKTTWITLLVCCTILNAMAQDQLTTNPTTYEIGVSLGLNQWQILDRNTSPLAYRALQTDVGLHFKYFQNHSMMRIGFRGALGHVRPANIPDRDVYFQEKDENGEQKTVAVPANGNLLSFRMDIGYQYILNPNDLQNRFGLGLTISDELYNPSGFTRPGLMNIASLNPSMYYEHEFSPAHRVHVNASAPIFAFVTRMPYDNTVSLPGKSPIAGLFSKGTNFSSWANYQAFELGLGYKGRISDNINAGIDYVYQWKSIAQPKPLKMQNNLLLASFLYEF